MAIAIARTTQCPYCLDVHTRRAKRAAASREQATQGTLALEPFDSAKS